MKKTLITGLTALTLLYGCSRDEAPKPVPQQDALVVPRPAEPPVSNPTPIPQYLTVSLHSRPDGLETAFELSFGRQAAQDFARYESTMYHVEGTQIQGEMYFQQGMSGLKNTLAEPVELEGKSLVFYGRQQGEWQELYRVRLGEE